jgi:hypothetical protein
MKENAPLLIVLAVMLLVVAAILLPDYFACHPIVLVTTAQEARAEALEASDLHRFVRGPVREITIEHNALTMLVDEAPPTDMYKVRDAVEEAWKRSYVFRHYDSVDAIPCLRFTITDVNSHESETCESHDSVMRLFENDCEF